jgi:hypothetical protein
MVRPGDVVTADFTLPLSSVAGVGRLSDADWQAVQRCLQQAVATN